LERPDLRRESAFSRLAHFARRHRHTRVPPEYRDGDGYPLGRWVVKQRTRRAGLSKDRVRRLEALPDWTWDPFEAAWEDGFARLSRFAERKGHTTVPAAYRDGGGTRLYWWDHKQRANRERLGEDGVRRLEALPHWRWSSQCGD